MRLIHSSFNPRAKKSIFIVYIPKHAGREASMSGIEKAQHLKVAAEHSGYVTMSTDVATMFDTKTHVHKDVEYRRERECRLLSSGAFDVIHYSGSGLSSDHLQDIARAEYLGETPVYLDIPHDSVLARYIVHFKFNVVNRTWLSS